MKAGRFSACVTCYSCLHVTIKIFDIYFDSCIPEVPCFGKYFDLMPGMAVPLRKYKIFL